MRRAPLGLSIRACSLLGCSLLLTPSARVSRRCAEGGRDARGPARQFCDAGVRVARLRTVGPRALARSSCLRFLHRCLAQPCVHGCPTLTVPWSKDTPASNARASVPLEIPTPQRCRPPRRPIQRSTSARRAMAQPQQGGRAFEDTAATGPRSAGVPPRDRVLERHRGAFRRRQHGQPDEQQVKKNCLCAWM